ncbi:MAG: cytochrome c biogenesis protein CcsA [Salibacteraceae bacterium]
MEYTGEHLLIGELGNIFLLIAFAFGILSTIAYFLAEQRSDDAWRKVGRLSFWMHSIGVVGMVGTLFVMIFNQYFEYHYVWQHSSSELPLRYIFSCFWEGIEGSFMLWMFWHVIIANILLYSLGHWERSVMAVIGSVQIFLTSMLLGVYIFEYKLGSNPFTVLTREHPDFVNLPIFQMSDYISVLDGRGLNPLLQNYWMTIHPPTLFLGFSIVLVPFAYAIAGLWRKMYIEWVKPALPWTFAGIGVLGIGILMGGAWAYEALSFGGFWAWDPVENASLVPWLILVGAGHLMLIQRKKGTSVLTMFMLITLSFVLIQYSSFLTKSGILGDSSVHSFTDLGMTGQLAISLIFFIILSAGLIIYRAKDFPKNQQEDHLWSREFWMFIGSLILFLSAFQIEFSTSFPVINTLFGTDLAQSAERIEYYNKWQLPLAIIISAIIGFGQFLKYKKTDPKTLLKNLSVAISLGLILTIGLGISMTIKNPLILTLLFTSAFAAFANLDYLIRVVKGKIKHAGSSIAHIGFALILLGALVSTSQSDTISQNTSLYDVSVLGEDFSNNENILLMKDDTLMMGEYFVSYRGKEKEGVYIHYEVDYMQPNAQGDLSKVFTLYPFVQLNPRMGNVAEPYTKHYINKDIYTHITYAELEERKREEESNEHQLKIGDTLFAKNSFLILDSLNRKPDLKDKGLKETDLALGAKFTLYDVQTTAHNLEPLFVIRDRQYSFSVPDSVPNIGVEIAFEGIDPETESFSFKLTERDPKYQEFIVMKAIVFPWINILWIGCILMGLGTVLAVYLRIRRA